MANLKLFLFGPPQVVLEGQPVDIKRRKAMAMLIYLAVTGQAHSRDALATLFYPDHDQSRARAYLRRDLAVLNTSLERDWLEIERDRVELEQAAGFWLDVGQFQQLLAQSQSHDHEAGTVCADCLSLLAEAAELYTDDFLAGFTLRDCPEFDDWQFFQAESLRQEFATVLEQLVEGLSDQGEPEAAIPQARRWVSLDPLREPAQRRLIQLYDQSGQPAAALRQYEEFVKLLEEELGLPPEEETTTVYEAIKAKRMLEPYVRAAEQNKTKTPKAASPLKSTATDSTSVVALPAASSSPSDRVIAQQLEQEIRFCITSDETRLAYATVGEGPVLVKAANWLSHLEYDWQSPVWRHWLSGLAQHHTLVRYDERGCGLSDWKVNDLSFEAWARDLETVVNAAGLERFPLLGISQGVAIAIAYAARHPEKVSQLILYGGYVRGRLKRDLTPQQLEETQTFIQLIKLGWGQENPAFRQVFTTLFMPDASLEQQQAFNELQRISTSPENAMRLVAGFDTVDVRHLAPQVAAPTLVLHATGDARIPFAESELIANLIPGARLVPLESKNHILLENEPAWPQFLAEVHQFLGVESEERPASAPSQSRPTPPPSMLLSLERSTPPHNLPAQPTEFIGRENELAEIRRLLVEERGCRLLTLVGPGGIGKTRLAIEAASEIVTAFADGVYYVPLASVDEPEYIGPAIAQALEISFQGGLEPEAQLLHYLRDKKLLLIVDNFEHLLSKTEVVRDILQAAPQVKLLTTSRERLNLQEEWNYLVQGMPFPQTIEAPLEKDSQIVAENSAIQLFLQRARQAEASFDYSAKDMPHIVHICQLVDGMPLGLELAAPWVRLMSCQEIAEEIERSFDILATSLRNVPERHRSLRAIFEQTWTSLSEAEQAILSRLSVFQGGCLIDAATAVTGATLAQLSLLVDRALLRRTGNGRYEMHELIRQFATAQLQHAPDEYDEVRNLHKEYYTQLLRRCTDDLKRNRQQEALEEIAAEINNVRAAWRRAIEIGDMQSLGQATESLWFFGEFRGALFEIDALFGQAVEALTSTAAQNPGAEHIAQQESLTGFLLAAQGYLRARQHKLEEGQALAQRGVAKLRQARSRDRQKGASALIYLGYVLHFQGRYAEVKQVAEESLALFSEIGDRWNEAWGLFLLGSRAQWSGQLEEAERYLQKSKAISGNLGDFLIRSYTNLELGLVALKRGEYARAKYLLDEALQIKQEFRDALGTADTLRDLGRLAIAQGNYDQAIELMQKSLAIFGESGGEWVVAARLGYLGTAFRLQGDFERADTYLRESLDSLRASGQRPDMARNLSKLGCLAYDRQIYAEAEQLQQEALAIWEEVGNEPEMASVLRYLGHIAAKSIEYQETKTRQYYQRALQLAIKHKVAPVSLDVFVGVAPLLTESGEWQRVVEILSLAQHHSASTAETKEKAHRCLAELPVDLSSNAVTAAKSRGEMLDWQVTARQIIDELSRLRDAKPPRPTNLPVQTTPFVGRAEELAKISDLLSDAGCRLLTLLGPGGVGKTRLALEAAGRALDAFHDGVYFVPLAPLQSAENIVSTIADSLEFQFAGPKAPKAQLLGYLRDKRLLLILDNFEHLLAPPEGETTGGADLAAELLAAVPNLKMLVTSRQRLNLSGETVYTLSGLTYPDDWQRAAESNATDFSAVQLLLQRARQVQPDAEPTSLDLAQVVRICQLVEGMPLALILAASWVEALSLQEIADEIEESLDFLETELRDLPERQRSVRVVFEASWKRLSLDEQEALMKLSVFRGGFTREAARTVAEADLSTLRNLANKSLLSLSGKGRYEMHELLRQFVEAQLSAVAREEARDRHGHYYLNLLQEQEKTLQSDRQPAVIAELMLEIDNLRAAWIWAVIQKQVTSLWQASWPQYYFYDLRNYYQEGEAVFHRAQEALQILADGDPDNTAVTATLGRITAFRAFHAMRLGQTQGALAWLRPFIGRLRDHRGELDMKMALMDVLWIYGLGCWFSGEFTEGLSLLQEALALSRELERPWHTAASLAFIGVILHEQGDYAQAYEVLNECLTISRQMGDPRAISFSISFLGRAAHALGQYEEMLVLLREGLALVQQAGDRVSIGLALEQMANGHYALGDIAEAHRYFQESLAIYREIDDAWSLSRILNTLGNIALAKNDLSEAEQQFIKAFRTAMETEFTANALDALAGLAHVRARAGFEVVALELAEIIVQHPGSTQAALEQAEQLGMEISDHLNPQKVESVQASARNKTLEMVAIELGELARGELLPLTVGQRFIQQDLIATGGMGEVYLGQDQAAGQPVAIKRLKPELVTNNPEAVQRFVREGEILRQLNHPNIVKVLATFETEGQPSIVMEYVPGGSLQDLLEEGSPLPLEQALNIGLELADALARAHHLGVIHRDLKPANVLLAADGTPRLSDFGIAYLVQPETRLTQEGAILGTTVYMSPEAWRGEELDARSDIWSFGAVLYEMLAGQPPFAAEQPVAIMTAIMNDPVPDLYQFRPEAPPGLVELITQMLAKERARRLESMRQVAAGLELIRQIK